MSDPSTEGAYLLPLTGRYRNLKPMADISAFDVVFSYPLTPPSKVVKPPGKEPGLPSAEQDLAKASTDLCRTVDERASGADDSYNATPSGAVASVLAKPPPKANGNGTAAAGNGQQNGGVKDTNGRLAENGRSVGGSAARANGGKENAGSDSIGGERAGTRNGPLRPPPAADLAPDSAR